MAKNIFGEKRIEEFSRERSESTGFLKKLYAVFNKLVSETSVNHNRFLPFGEYFVDRWEKAKYLGFGDGSSVYDSALIIGDVEVGSNTWVGPNVVLDGSGGLIIGSNCSISSGVQVYSHDSVKWAISGGVHEYEYKNTRIGNRCYLGPNVIVQMGVTIGDNVIVGANSFVNQDIPSNSKAYGNPAVTSSV